jgi:hypothetical protein
MKNYTDVELITDKYKAKGANKGDKGSIIEILAKDQYLLELYDFDTGITKTMIVVREEDIKAI